MITLLFFISQKPKVKISTGTIRLRSINQLITITTNYRPDFSSTGKEAVKLNAPRLHKPQSPLSSILPPRILTLDHTLASNTSVKISISDGSMLKLEILYPHPALKLTEAGEDYLVVSDLHIGFEQRFNREGFNITPSTDKMLQTLTELIQQHKPDRLLILGDVKSGFSKISRDEWEHIPKFMEKITTLVEISVIPGNHDGGLTPLLPREVKLESKEILTNDTGFLHGHTHPSRRLQGAKRLVMGHIHPSYSRKGNPLSGRPVWLTLKAKKKLIFDDFEDDDLLEVWVMPSFNTELSATGLTVYRERIISPLLRKIDGNVAEALIITLDGSIIGDIDSIQYVL